VSSRRAERDWDDISDRLLEFSVRVGKVVERLPDSRLGRHVAGQLIRCGTSPYPNYEEARAAESPADFIHKLRICLKELRESRSWLNVIARSQMIQEQSLVQLLDECEQLGNIIGSSVLTATRNSERSR
jgi:four helix bundle protein